MISLRQSEAQKKEKINRDYKIRREKCKNELTQRVGKEGKEEKPKLLWKLKTKTEGWETNTNKTKYFQRNEHFEKNAIRYIQGKNPEINSEILE